MHGKSNKTAMPATVACLDDDLLYRYLEKLVPAEERQLVERHLNTCNACFGELAALARDAHAPATEAEKIELARLPKLSPQEQTAKILDYLQAESASTPLAPGETAQKVFQKEGSVAFSLWQQFKHFFEMRQWQPQYALALTVLVVGIAAAFFAYIRLNKNNADALYAYDDRVPYEYEVSGLRGAEPARENSSLFQAFVTQFKQGMSDYVLHDYAGAIRVLQEAEPTARALQAVPNNDSILPWLRDYYFYLGVSHFAQSRRKAGDLSSEARQQHALQAIHWLTLADSLTIVREFPGSDREIYFLGLAYGFGGRADSAVAQLRKINAESRYYNESVQLIRQWSK